MRSETLWRYLTLSPAVVLFFLLTLLPLANLLALGFHDVEWANRTAIWTFVGGENYRALLDDTLFRAGIWNTILFAVVAVAIQMVIGFWMALLTVSITRGRIVYRTIFLLPILMPGIVIGAIWKLMYSFDFGVINQIIGLVGIPPQDWLGNANLALASVIVVDIWHWTPFCYLLMLAALESLPEDVFEAARMDGATGFNLLRYVTVPLVLPAIIVTFIFRLILAFKVFDQIYLLTGGGPGTSTEVISFTIYRRFFTEDRSGYGAALSIATFMAIAALIFIALRISRRKGGTQ